MSSTHAQESQTLSLLEQQLLEIIQQGFPLCPDPYAEIARQAGCTREEAHRIVLDLRERKVIRRIGASFTPAKLGYISALVAVRVDPTHLEEAAARAAAYPEVTHNYERADIYNLWFTVIAEDQQRQDEILDDVRRCEGVHALYALPAIHTFKIKVDFKFGKGEKDA